MVADLLLRLALAAVLIAVGVAAYWGWNRLQLRRLSRAATASLLGLETRPRGVPAVLYFRTPDCVVCAAAQRPALDRLAGELGPAVHIIEIDAAAQPAVADYWGVLSVPTTFVVDAQGQPRAVNHGLASKDKLRRQLEALPPVETPRPAQSSWAGVLQRGAQPDLDAAPVRDTIEAA
jgi:thioredoxin-like negative regulator of GroEL